MKKLTTLFLLCISGALMAQIPNADFETWAGGVPTGWYSTTALISSTTVQQTGTHYSGSSAALLNSVLVSSNYVGGSIQSGDASTKYFYNAGNPAILVGYYILSVNGGDELIISTGTKCAPNTLRGVGAATFNTNTTGSNVFKQFTVQYNYIGSAGQSDSMQINFELTNTSGSTHSGSYAVIDDLSATGTVGLDEISDNVTLEKSYPNPASAICNIIYSIPNSANVNVSLYDISGRMVKNILDDTYQTVGRYKIPVDVSGLSNGIYIYRVVVDGQVYAQKLTVARN